MNTVFKIFLSMSFSGGLLILVLLLGKRLLRDKISRQWQYYIWLVVILRLLLPFGAEVSLLGKTYQAVDQAITRITSLSKQSTPDNLGDALVPKIGLEENNNAPAPVIGLEQNNNALNPAIDLEQNNKSAKSRPLQDIGALLTNHIWIIWLVAAFGLIVRKISIYQGFIHFIDAGLTLVSEMEILDKLSIIMERTGNKKPIELGVNPLVSSPLLIGFFRPCIVLPSLDISEKDFLYIILHELTHHKRRDMFYKWLVQITVCLHWFNPLVYLMSLEITKACEFSCDEAVLAKMGSGNAKDYGKTLLDAMAAVGKYKGNLGSVTLSGNKKLLKERLEAMMNFKKKSMMVHFLTSVLTLGVIFGAIFVGTYPVAAADLSVGTLAAAGKTPAQKKTDSKSNRYSQMAEQYYRAGNLPLFQIVFGKLDEKTQSEWLDRIYADENIAFMGAVITLLDEDDAAILQLAEKIYKDDDIAFFSALAMQMSEERLEEWLDRALEDENWAFSSMLFNTLGWDEELDKFEEAQEKEWEEAQIAEYRAAGVTMDGKDYYYREKLVNIFLDIRSNKSFYTLNMNPKGSVNIRIIRDKNNEITGVAYMTETEVTELLNDMHDDEEDLEDMDWNDDWDSLKDVDCDDLENMDWDDWDDFKDININCKDNGKGMDDNTRIKIIPVNDKRIAAGKTIYLGEYNLSNGDKIRYDLLAEKGEGMQVFFAKDEHKDKVYWSVHNLRQPGEVLECTADFTIDCLEKSGTYKLFLSAVDGALEKVVGNIFIITR